MSTARTPQSGAWKRTKPNSRARTPAHTRVAASAIRPPLPIARGIGAWSVCGPRSRCRGSARVGAARPVSPVEHPIFVARIAGATGVGHGAGLRAAGFFPPYAGQRCRPESAGKRDSGPYLGARAAAAERARRDGGGRSQPQSRSGCDYGIPGDGRSLRTGHFLHGDGTARQFPLGNPDLTLCR